jgi:PEP-CTERM motif
MRSCQTKTLLGAAFMLLVNAGLSYGDTVIVSNLTATVNGTGTIYNSGSPQEYAQEFLTGSSSAVLSSIVVALGGATGTFAAGAELLSDNNGVPDGTIVSAFTVPTIPTTSFSDLTFTPMSNVTLKANTDYWFVLAATGSGGSYQWQYTNTLSTSFPNYAYSNNNGASWTIGTPAGPFLLQANAAAVSAVPEPSSLVLAAIGLLALGMVLRARRLRTSE